MAGLGRVATRADDIIGRLDDGAGFRAYHGSPYDFDRFDSSKMGSGEGAQAYGHGLYFAGNEGTAKTYREKLSDGTLKVEGASAPLTEKAMREMGLGVGAIGYIRRAVISGKDPIEALQEVKAMHRPLSGRWFEMDDAQKFLRGANGPLQKNPGRMYEVGIATPEDSLLDWDKTLDQQPHMIRRAEESIRRIKDPDAQYDALIAIEEPDMNKGRDIWGVLRDSSAIEHGIDPWNPKRNQLAGELAARNLLESGIPGIRYLDGQSRRVGEGTRNYVMFPGTEDKIQILRKYGILAPLAAGAASQE